MELWAGGGPVVLIRDLGTPSPVAGLQAGGAPAYGAQLATAIVRTVRMRSPGGALQLQIPASGFTLLAEAGVFSLAGQDVALRLARRMVADAGAFSLDGQDAALLLARRLVADAGAFSLEGQDAALLLARRLVAEVGAFGLDGQDAALLLARRLVAEAGVFSLVGQDVDFVLQTSGAAAFAHALHRHAQLARQGSRPAVTAVQVLAAVPKGRISTKGVGGP